MEKLQTKNRVIEIYELPAFNFDQKTVESFGQEWTSFHNFSEADIKVSGDKYFDIVNANMLNESSRVIDIGCGSGRFIKYLKGRYSTIVGIDPSSAIFAADELLGKDKNIQLMQASTDNIPFPDNYFDFGYSLGVLHHIPDTQKALNDSVKKIKPGGYFLLYLYYNMDNRSAFFKSLFHVSNVVRWCVCRLQPRLKRVVCDLLAALFYMPFIFFCRFLKLMQVPEGYRRLMPLQAYEQQSFYVIRNDSLDRFGTPLEQRFSKEQINEMMNRAGLKDIVFSANIPYWHAVGKKA